MAYNDPKTKEQVLNRMLSMDFSGNLKDIGKDGNVSLQRIKRHVLRLIFLDSQQKFDITIHKPRAPKKSQAKPKPKLVQRAQVEDIEPEVRQPPPATNRRRTRSLEVA